MKVAPSESIQLDYSLDVVDDREAETQILKYLEIGLGHSMIRHTKNDHVGDDDSVDEDLKWLRQADKSTVSLQSPRRNEPLRL